MRYKIMEKVIKEFQYTHKLGQTETIYNFKAVIKPSYFANYRIKTTAVRFENGEIKARTKSTLYFKEYNEMVQEFQFQYELCKRSESAKLLKIIR